MLEVCLKPVRKNTSLGQVHHEADVEIRIQFHLACFSSSDMFYWSEKYVTAAFNFFFHNPTLPKSTNHVPKSSSTSTTTASINRTSTKDFPFSSTSLPLISCRLNSSFIITLFSSSPIFSLLPLLLLPFQPWPRSHSFSPRGSHIEYTDDNNGSREFRKKVRIWRWKGGIALGMGLSGRSWIVMVRKVVVAVVLLLVVADSWRRGCGAAGLLWRVVGQKKKKNWLKRQQNAGAKSLRRTVSGTNCKRRSKWAPCPPLLKS